MGHECPSTPYRMWPVLLGLLLHLVLLVLQLQGCLQEGRNFDSGDDSGGEGPSTSRKANKASRPPSTKKAAESKTDKAAQRQQQSDLELLMMDDDALLAARDGVKSRLLAAGVHTPVVALACAHFQNLADCMLRWHEHIKRNLVLIDIPAR